jgi:hypothetical protein
MTPWCKVGNTLFRATSIIESGGQIRVEAHIVGGEVLAAVEGMRRGQWGRGAEVRCSGWGGHV